MAFSVRDILRLNRRRPRRGAKTVMRLPQIIQAAAAEAAAAGLNFRVVSSSDTVADDEDGMIVSSSASSGVTITLPTPAAKVLYFGYMGNTQLITLSPAGGATLYGTSTSFGFGHYLPIYGVIVIGDGTDWYALW